MVEERRAEKGAESLFCAAQEQAIRTNLMKYTTDKTGETPRYRLYNENFKSVTHIITNTEKA